MGNYLAGRNQPKALDLVAIARAAGVSVEWLATGNPPMRESERAADEAAPRAAPKADAPAPLGSVPVLGLAQCGLKGWYQEDRLAVRAIRPPGLDDPDAFAMIAIGQSMAPAGILAGYLCFCAPGLPAEPGDAVVIERREGKRTIASIKRLRKIEPDWLVLEGWLAPEDGRQEIYTEKVRRSEVVRTAPVIYVKMKL